MKQLKALAIKEWRTNRSTLLIPLWFTLGAYAIGLLGLIIGLVKGQYSQMLISVQNVPSGMGNFLVYSSVYGVMVMLGSVAIISAITLSDSMINGGFKRKCEILHLSQPVSLIKIISVKYAMLTFGTILLFAGLGLVNSLVISFVQAYYTSAHIYFGLIAWFQATIEISLSLIFLASIYWFFAGVYKRKSFFFGTLTILGIQAAISIWTYTAGLHIPSLLGYIVRLGSIQFNVQPSHLNGGINRVLMLCEGKWQHLLSWDSVLKLLYSSVLFVAGYFLYKRKELT
jgi:hypothetical protein